MQRYPIILVFFFFSGASALVYEIVWVRQLTLVFGNTVQATATVLARSWVAWQQALMRWEDVGSTDHDPCAFMPCWNSASPLRRWFSRSTCLPYRQSTARFTVQAAAGRCLVVVRLQPALCFWVCDGVMGGTLPALAKRVVAGPRESRSEARHAVRDQHLRRVGDSGRAGSG